jgi:hypothetical protein
MKLREGWGTPQLDNAWYETRATRHQCLISKLNKKETVILSERGPRRISAWGWKAKDLRLLFRALCDEAA